jgi:hypothetical protein
VSHTTRPLPASYIPLTVGPGPRYRPGVHPRSAPVTASEGLDCEPNLGPRFGVHVELFANRHVVLVPPAIGVFRPIVANGVVRGGRCYYPLVTLDPTGVVEIGDTAYDPTLGTLFVLWGHSLSSTRLAGFAGAVHTYVNGRPVRGDPAGIRLRVHDEIVLETSGYVVPHGSYRFADGL